MRSQANQARVSVLQSTPRLEFDDVEVELPNGVLRVIAYLATNPAGASRSQIGGSLWPDADEHRANSNLRSSLWRLRRSAGPFVETVGHRLRLHPSVDIDMVRVSSIAEAAMDGSLAGTWAEWLELIHAEDVIGGWSEEWLAVPRERFRQLRLSALEKLAAGLATRGEHGQALACAMAAVETDPLRESAHRILIDCHLQQGNCSEALRQYEAYSTVMTFELGLEPSRDMTSLVDRCRRPGKRVDAPATMVEADPLRRIAELRVTREAKENGHGEQGQRGAVAAFRRPHG